MLTRMPDADRLQAARMLPLLEGGPADMALLRGRVHEVCGPARRTLAAMAMGRVAAGTVLWILPAWLAERRLRAAAESPPSHLSRRAACCIPNPKSIPNC